MIEFYDGTTYHEIGQIQDTDGTTTHIIGRVEDYDGATYNVVFESEKIIDLNNFSQLSTSATYINLELSQVRSGTGADTNGAIRMQIDTRGYSTLTVEFTAGTATYKHSGICVSTDAWTWGKSNFGTSATQTNRYIWGSPTNLPATVLYKKCDAGDTANIDVSGVDSVYVTLGAFSFSATSATATARVLSIKLN